MGGCLITNPHQAKQTIIFTAVPTLRQQIEAEILTTPKTTLLNPLEEQEENHNAQVSIDSIKLDVNDKTPYTSSKIIQSNTSFTDHSGHEEAKRRIKRVVITKQAAPSMKETSRSYHEEISRQLTLSEEDTQEFQKYQTAQNRLYLSLTDMVGEGLRDQDNFLIESSKTNKQVIKLHAVKFKNGSTYLGEWKQAKRHGKGILFWRDGSRYQGQWVENCSQGYGKLIYNQNQYYEGSFIRNFRHGKGKLTSFNTVYQGQWMHDKMEGQGKQSWGNGSYYQGNWERGCKHGEGCLFFEDGSYYKGNFNSNQIHGHGEYYWVDSRTYVGSWEHNRMNGKGELTWKNGEKYVGQFKSDKMHGFGRLVQDNSCIYEGYFSSGRKHGKGTQTDSEGKEKKVQYYMGRKISFDKNSNSGKRKRQNILQHFQHGATC